jgi:hypothetical protein
VVIGYLHIVRVTLFPRETDTPLIVDTDAVLSRAISGEFLQPISGWNAKILQSDSVVKHFQLA